MHLLMGPQFTHSLDRPRASRNIYLLMQIAYNLWQLFNSGCLKRHGEAETSGSFAVFGVKLALLTD